MMRMLLAPVITCIVLLLASHVYASEAEADVILGQWFTDGNESVVEIYKCGDMYCGKIVWLKEPTKEDGSEKVDKNNPDESKRDRKIIGLNIVSDFEYSGRNSWSNGSIYDPDKGKTYSCKAKLKGDELSIRGFIGISAFGRTTVWVRKEAEQELQ